MKRTKYNDGLSANEFHALASALVARAQLATRLGFAYSGNRDVYQALGYPTTINFKDYLGRYLRQDIATAIIDRPIDASWAGPLELIETDEADETPFETAWRKLERGLGIKDILIRVDRLIGIGRYGVLLLGLDDVANQAGFRNPVRAGTRKLLYLRPFSEETAKISTYELNPKNRRYGKPLLYEIQVADSDGTTGMTVQVHYSRIIHIIDKTLESDIFGIPRLETVYNRMMDLEKVVGGDGEMFWRGARPGYQGVVDKEYTVTPSEKKKFQEQIDEFEHNLRRILIQEGITLKELAQQISDPKSHVDVILTLVSAVTGIPKRILSGSERGELASTQDTGEWKTYVKNRRENLVEPKIIRPLVDRLIKLGILPELQNEEYHADWEDLFAVSEKERVEIGKDRANAIREYTYNPMEQDIVPEDAFLEFMLGFDRKQIELMKQMKGSAVRRELNDEDVVVPPMRRTKPVQKTTIRRTR